MVTFAASMAVDNSFKSGPEKGSDTGLILLRRFVVKALQTKLKGDPSFYNSVLSQVNDMKDDPRLLRVFSECVSQFDEHAHSALLAQILGVGLWTCKGDIADAILAFIINLASANSACISLCLDTLVRNFLPPAAAPSARASQAVWDQQIVCKDAVLAKIHLTLAKVIELVPTATTRLQPILLNRMPFRGLRQEVLELYLENLFRLAESRTGEVLRESLLLAVVDLLTSIDVEIKWSHWLEVDEAEIEGAAEEQAHLEEGMFDMDLQEDHRHGVLGSEPTSTSYGHSRREQEVPEHLKEEVQNAKEMAMKLDVLMTATFQHLIRRIEKDQLLEVFDTLMRSFQSTIMQTFRSKFVQFLVFFVCTKSSYCAAAFVNLLIEDFTTPANPPSRRLAAAAYLASFLARARCLLPQNVMSALSRLGDWLSDYVEKASKPQRHLSLGSVTRLLPTPDTVRHSVFYSGCQALFYGLMYHMGALSQKPDGLAMLRRLPLQSLVDCRLNPLEVCRESIVEEFATQAEALHLANCSAVITANRGGGAATGCSFGGENHLDMFFPFDPYVLGHSKRFITGTWLAWDDVIKPYTDRDEGSDKAAEDLEGDDSLSDEDVGGKDNSYRTGGESLGRSFDPMSYTPPRAIAAVPAALPAFLPGLKRR